jgi:CheY-like chemotaxis protein
VGAADFLSKGEALERVLPRTITEAAERHRTQAERLRLEDLISKNPDAQLVVSDVGRVLFANAAAADLLGHRGDLVGTSLPFELEPSTDSAVELRRPDGVRHYAVKAAPIRWLGRDAQLASMRDDTESQRITLELGQSQKLEAIERLAGGVAHDFTNLVTVIFTYANALASTLEADDDRHSDLREILGAAERARELTQQLVAFSQKRDPQSPPNDSVAVGAAEATAEPATLLLAEDDPGVRRATALILESLGHHVVEACDGREALRLVHSGRFHFSLVLTDLMMPSMNGLELAQALREDYPGLPVLLMTGYFEGPDPTRFGYRLLSKPFRPAELESLVRESLEERDERKG